MRVKLDPVIEEKLSEILRHRRNVALLRAFAAVGSVFLCATIIGAFLDFLFVLSDTARWALSAFVYGATLMAFVRFGILPFVRLPKPKDLALFVENVKPDLREQLTSAVELALESPDARYDSPIFRLLLQKRVAKRIRPLQAREVLPLRLVKNWLIAVSMFCLFFAGLFFMPDLEFQALVTRTLIPLSNLDRVSRVKVQILKPKPPDGYFPEGEEIHFEVKTSQPIEKKVWVEIVKKDGSRDKVAALKGPEETLYEVKIAPKVESFRYRIRAGDALTAYHKIEIKARPSSVGFDISYIFPAYTRWPPRKLNMLPTADLRALRGTKVLLVVHTDQELSKGYLEMDQGGRISEVPLENLEGKALKGSFEIHENGQYKIHFTARETGFENASEEDFYKIEALEDSNPLVEIEKPADKLLLPPDSVVEIVGHAKDDVGLASISELYKVNQGNWSERLFWKGLDQREGSEAQKKVEIRKAFDLLNLSLRGGEIIQLKLKAVDLKGNESETQPVRLFVAPCSLKLSEREGLEALREALKEVRNFKDRLVELEGRSRKSTFSLDELLISTEESGSKAKKALLEACSYYKDSALSEALTVSGHVLDWILKEKLHSFASPSKEKLTLGTAIGFMREVERVLVSLVGGEELRILLQDLSGLKDQFLGLGEAFREEKSASRAKTLWKRKTQQIQPVFESLLEELSGKKGDFEPLNRGKISQAKVQLNVVRGILEANPSARTAQAMLSRALRAFESSLGPIKRGYFESLKQLSQNTQRFLIKQNLLVDSLKKLYGYFRKRESLMSRSRSSQEKSRVLKTTTEMIHIGLKNTLDLLSGWAEGEEAREDSNKEYLSDLDLLRKALMSLEEAERGNSAGQRERAERISSAFEVLETWYSLNRSESFLRQVASLEEAKFPSIVSVRTWSSFTGKFEVVGENLKAELIPEKARRHYREIGKSSAYRKISSEMRKRIYQAKIKESCTREARELLTLLVALKKDLLEVVSFARKTLRELSLPLSERILKLSEKAKQAERSSQQALRAPSEGRSEALAEALRKGRELLSELGGLLRDLERAFQRESLLTEESLERARDYKASEELLRRRASKAERSLRQAFTLPEWPLQKQALKRAASEEGQLAETLKEVAEHFRGLEKASTRAPLREAEKEAGVADFLDRLFDRLRPFSQLSALSPQGLLRALEEELQRNLPMQRELSQIARDKLGRAMRSLKEAEKEEGKVERELTEEVEGRSERLKALKRDLEGLVKKAEGLEGSLSRIGQSLSTPKALKSLQEGAEALKKAKNIALSPERILPSEIEEAASAFGKAGKAFEELAKEAQKELQASAGKASDLKGKREALAEAVRGAISAQAYKRAAERAAYRARKEAGAPQSALKSQDRVEGMLSEAGDLLEAAGRHEARLGRESLGGALQQVGKQVHAISGNEISQARAAIQSKEASKAVGAVKRARQAIGGALSRLEDLLSSKGEVAGAFPEENPGAFQGRSQTERLSSQRGSPKSPLAQQGQMEAASGQRSAQGAESAGAASSLAQSRSGKGSGLSQQGGIGPAAGRYLAQALDLLDWQIFGPGAGRSQGSGDRLKGLLSQAAQAQAQALSSSLSEGRAAQVAGRSALPASVGFVGSSTGGASLEGRGSQEEPLPKKAALGRSFEWGKLPKKVLKGIIESKHAKVPPQYRSEVEAYFRALAEKASSEGR